MNEEHAYLKRMQEEYGAVIQYYGNLGGNWYVVEPNEKFNPDVLYRICPIWLEEQFTLIRQLSEQEAVATVEEHGFKMGQTYWFVSSPGEIEDVCWLAHSSDYNLYDMGNTYHTKQEAQIACDRQLARVRVERRIKELDAKYPVDCLYMIVGMKGGYDEPSFALAAASNWGDFPLGFNGSKDALEQVIKEMRDDIFLGMGWDSE